MERSPLCDGYSEPCHGLVTSVVHSLLEKSKVTKLAEILKT